MWGFLLLSTEGFIYFLRHNWYLSWHPACPLTLTYKLFKVSYLSLAKTPCILATCLHHTLPPYPPQFSFLKLPSPSTTMSCNPSDVIAQQLPIDFQFPLFFFWSSGLQYCKYMHCSALSRSASSAFENKHIFYSWAIWSLMSSWLKFSTENYFVSVLHLGAFSSPTIACKVIQKSKSYPHGHNYFIHSFFAHEK